MAIITLSHISALQAIRYARCRNHHLGWTAIGRIEQRHALQQGTLNRHDIDLDLLPRYGIELDERCDKLHVLVPHANARRRHSGIAPHVAPPASLPNGALLRIAPDLYSCSPAYAALLLSRHLSLGATVSLLMELLGTYSLPCEATMPIHWGGVWPDSIERNAVEQAHYGCEPAVSIKNLREIARTATSSSYATFRTAVNLVNQPSASPGETIMFGMFGLPMRYGGFNCNALPHGGMHLNKRVDFTGRSCLMASGIPYAICDAYIPSSKTDLEYNGLGHEQTAARIHDGNRNNGLRGMGIKVIVINRDQMRDIDALEAMAQSIHSDANVRFRYRIRGYRRRQVALLNSLRQACGLPRV